MTKPAALFEYPYNSNVSANLQRHPFNATQFLSRYIFGGMRRDCYIYSFGMINCEYVQIVDVVTDSLLMEILHVRAITVFMAILFIYHEIIQRNERI